VKTKMAEPAINYDTHLIPGIVIPPGSDLKGGFRRGDICGETWEKYGSPGSKDIKKIVDVAFQDQFGGTLARRKDENQVFQEAYDIALGHLQSHGVRDWGLFGVTNACFAAQDAQILMGRYVGENAPLELQLQREVGSLKENIRTAQKEYDANISSLEGEVADLKRELNNTQKDVAYKSGASALLALTLLTVGVIKYFRGRRR